MCGISGIISNNLVDKSRLNSMIKQLDHRGPDDKGIYINSEKNVGLGHNRLSIIDLSVNGHQPMRNNEKNCWITFNGEIYNYIELKKVLKDYYFKTQTDTEVILAAYEKWGEDCVKYFNGMFSFAIWDEKKKKLFCARDRVGIKPFYYTKSNNSFMFSSEIKALISAGYESSPNWKTWSEYLISGLYDHSNETFFNNVYSLRAGNTLSYVDGAINIDQYWNIDKITLNENYDNENEYCEKFLDLFYDSIKLRLRSDVPVGLNLSGGLDSASLLVSLANIGKKSKIKTFTSTFGDPKYDENAFTNKINTKLKLDSYIAELKYYESWDLLEKMMWHQEAPFGGIATIAYHKLHNIAKNHNVTVLLEGQGVDEMLAGYEYYNNEYELDKLNISINNKKTIGVEKYQDGSSFLHQNCINDELISHFKIVEFNTPFKSHLINALYRDFKYTKLPRVLRMNDHLSMAFGRELREPYLDHRIVEFLFSIPSSFKIRRGQTKYLLRKSMKNLLPNQNRLAKKRAVVTPQREWLQKELRSNILDLIYSKSFMERGIFNAKEVHASYEKYCNKPTENSFFIWQWINTELWFREFID